MRLLSGVYAPDEGRIEISGTLAPLLSLAVGFHPDLSGRENARIELMILGFSPKQIQQRMDQIIDFAEIGEFIDAPVRTYSTGMMMRLAFAAAVSVDPDVLLLDEVLAVGDAAFAEKCLARIDDFRERGKTIVLVTHSAQLVRERCDVAMWLDRGKVAAFGDPIEVTDAYYQAAKESERSEVAVQKPKAPLRTIVVYGNCQAEALANIIKKDILVQSRFRVIYYPDYETPGQARETLTPQELNASALLFSQHGPDPFPYLDQLPKECLIVRFPSVDLNLLWPFNCVNPYNRPKPPEFDWGPFPYGDRIILECVEKDMARDEILEYYLTGWPRYKPDLNRRARLETRDGHCDLKMAPWVMEHFRNRRLFWTVNHPTQIVLREVLQRLIHASASVDPHLQDADLEETQRVYFPAGEQLSIANIPIHPSLAEELQLEWYNPHQSFEVFGKVYSYEEYFRRMIDYCVSERAAAAITAPA